MSTVFATVTTPGPAGPPGRTPLWLTGTGVPAPGLGLDGDMYLNTATGDVFGPKASGAWGGIVANIKGSTGAAGPAGYSPLYIVAAGAPSSITGNNGDMYLNSTTSELYGPKTAGAWGGIVANIKGGTGSTGPAGPPGVGYTPRGAWAAGTTYLQGDQVTDVSILYISLQSSNTGHVPASSPTWWTPVGSGGSQTPWLSDINGAGFKLFSAGNIGIGTATPLTAIDAAGMVRATGTSSPASGIGVEIAYSGQGFVQAYDRTGAVFKQLSINGLPILLNPTSGGAVGIGTTTPSAALDVAGIIRATGATAPTSGVGIELAFSGSQAFISAYDRSGAAYKTINISGLQIWLNPANGGQVGIGTTSPVSKLSLGAGASSAAQRIALFELTDGSGPRAIGMANPTGAVFGLGFWLGGAVPTDTNAHVFFKDGGSVGIGTMSPGYKLDVAGDINCGTGSNVIRKNGLPICQISGGYFDVTASRALGTTYPNSFGVPIFVAITMTIAAAGFAQLLSDLSSPPTNLIFVQTNAGAASAILTVSGWVMPTHFYKINHSGATLSKWYEWQ